MGLVELRYRRCARSSSRRRRPVTSDGTLSSGTTGDEHGQAGTVVDSSRPVVAVVTEPETPETP